MARLLPGRSLHLSAASVHRAKELSGPTKSATEAAIDAIENGGIARSSAMDSYCETLGLNSLRKRQIDYI